MKVKQIFVISAVCVLSGCGVFAPENQLQLTPQTADWNSIENAYGYAESGKSALYKTVSDNSTAQTVISYGTYLASLTAAGLVLFSAPSDAIKGAGLAAGTLVSADYVVNPRARRSIADQGISAINCLESIALNMDALPIAFAASTSSSRAAPRASDVTRALSSLSFGLPPTPAFAGAQPYSVAPVTAASSSMRGYANSLLGSSGLRPAAPRAPGAPPQQRPSVPTPVAALIAGQVLQAADTQEAAMVAAANAANSAHAQAPQFLISGTEMVLSLVLSKLHGADRAASDIETQTKQAIDTAVANFKAATSNAASQSAKAKTVLNTATAITGIQGTANPSPAGDTPPAGIGGDVFPNSGAGTGSATVGGAPSSGTSTASDANKQLTQAESITALLSDLTSYSKACQGVAGGSGQ